MSKLSIRKQEKVLKILIDLYNSSSTQWIYHPVGFEKNFSFIDERSLINILDILNDKGYITVRYGDFPGCFNIDMITVTPSGLNYEPQKALVTRERWFERLYGFIVGTVLGSVVTYFIPKILDYILGNI